jgi:heat shock protein HslJ
MARTLRKRLTLFGATWLAIATVAGCSSDPTRSGTITGTLGAKDLLGSEWILEDLGGAGVIDGDRATITFLEGDRIAGNGTCNQFSGGAKIENGNIKVGPLAMTRKACPPALMDQETRYTVALQGAERIALDGPSLLIYSKGTEQPLKFARTK